MIVVCSLHTPPSLMRRALVSRPASDMQPTFVMWRDVKPSLSCLSSVSCAGSICGEQLKLSVHFPVTIMSTAGGANCVFHSYVVGPCKSTVKLRTDHVGAAYLRSSIIFRQGNSTLGHATACFCSTEHRLR